MSNRTTLSHAVVAACLVVLGTAVAAPAQPQGKSQQKCLNALNKDGVNVAKAQGKEFLGCLKDKGKGKLVGSAQDCLTADAKLKVQKKRDKTVVDETKSCTPPPDFGYAGATAVNDAAVQAVVFYIAAYAVMNIGAFGAAIAVNRRTGLRSVESYAGLGSRSPLLAMGLTTFLLSLGGAPPTVGLWAKFSIIQAAARSGSTLAFVLVAFLVVNSVIAFFYYLRIIWTMWMRPSAIDAPAVQAGFNLSVVVTALMIGTVILGILPGLISDYSAVGSVIATP